MSSLKQLCLTSIIEEFERIYLAFSVSTNVTLKRNFKFLQRKYSFELADGLYGKSKLKQEYLDFLLNEHLTYLDLKWFKKDFHKKCMKDIFCLLPNLVQVSCDETSDEILENVAKYCPKIAEINAPWSSVTDEGIKYLCKNENGTVPCPELKKISINSSKITDESLVLLLESLPFLEKIDHTNIPRILYSLHKENMHDSEKLPSYNLVHLNLFHNFRYHTDLLKVCLTVCPKLKTVNCTISDKDQLNLFNHQSLENVFIKCAPFTQDLNNFLKVNGHNLISLSAHDGIISLNVLNVSCPKLENLTLNDCIFSYDHNYPQPNFCSLKKCSFIEKRFNNTTIKALRSILSNGPNLEDLSFTFCQFLPNTEIYEKNSAKNRLKSVSFYSCSFVSSIVKNILLSCPNLERLDVQACNFSPLEKEELLDFKMENKLTSVNFMECSFASSIIKTILLSCPNLEDLSLFECKFSPREKEELMDFISDMPCNKPYIYSNGYYSYEYNFSF